jgi:hypothetical protein
MEMEACHDSVLDTLLSHGSKLLHQMQIEGAFYPAGVIARLWVKLEGGCFPSCSSSSSSIATRRLLEGKGMPVPKAVPPRLCPLNLVPHKAYPLENYWLATWALFNEQEATARAVASGGRLVYAPVDYFHTIPTTTELCVLHKRMLNKEPPGPGMSATTFLVKRAVDLKDDACPQTVASATARIANFHTLFPVPGNSRGGVRNGTNSSEAYDLCYGADDTRRKNATTAEHYIGGELNCRKSL